ncbi:MAG TPA: cadherin domain-containing protein, partial [Hyphomicrobiaceae bacterium]|nr:cadherin domain-containing protein [Hyphomicrobiaceae bacterium]
FNDDQTAANQLVYTATLADGSSLDSMGLTFEIIPDANGLVAAGRITGTPPQDFNGPIEVRITATDQGGLSVTDDFIINVLPVNDAPAITSDGGGDFAAVSVLENTTAVTTVTAEDPDTGTTLTYSIVGGDDAALFAIDPGTGALSFITPPDFEAPGDANGDNVYDVVVTVSDGTLTDTQSIAVTVGDANEAPVIVSNGGGDAAALSVAENSTAVTTVAATDQDAGATLAYAIVGGADASLFAIDPATGVLSFVAAPDFEAPADAGGDNVYDVVVAVSDGTLTDTQSIAVTVGDANEAPVIVSDGGGENAALSVAENSTAVTTVAATDQDAGATLAYAIVGGADASLFAIDPGTGALSFITAPNFEAPGDANGDNVYDVVVTVSDGTLTDTQSIAVTVGDANDAPVIVSDGGGDNAPLSVAENSTAVTTVAATDEDAGSTLTYAIVGGADASLFAIDPTTGVLSFIAAPDFEEPADADGDNVYDLIVSASDGVLDDTQAIAVAVSNVAGLTLTGTTAGNIIDGSGEEDIVDGLNGNDILSGGGGNDTLIGGVGSDIMNGDDGDDVLIGGGGNDIMDGGAGDDTFVYAIGDASDIIDGGDGFDTVAISGSAANETLDVIFNGTALTNFESAIVSNIETATADLGGGTDTLTYFGSTAAVTVNLEAGTASGFTSIAGIENVTSGSGNDLLTGDVASNILNGGAGNDTFFATVNDGNDTYNGAGDNDTYDLSATSAGATVTTTSATSAETGVDVLQSIENIIGSQGNDIITTSGSASFVDGQAGDDVIDAGAGTDTIIGGLGNDFLNGGSGNDTFVFAAGFGNDTIVGFDANPSSGQDLLDISELGITAATFAASVLIEDLGSDTLVTIGTDTVLLQGVDGTGTNIITQEDFLLLG